MSLPSIRAEYYAACLPAHVLQQYGEIRHESKTLQYLMGHSDIGVALNTYTHLGLEDAEDKLKRLEDLQNARKELERTQGEKPVSQKMFKAI